MLILIAAPTTAPDNLMIAVHNVTTFKVSWQPVASNNGPILVYRLLTKPIVHSAQQKLLNVSCSEVPCGISVSHDCNVYLHNLPQCIVYNITVRAYTSAGDGPFSQPATLATSGR